MYWFKVHFKPMQTDKPKTKRTHLNVPIDPKLLARVKRAVSMQGIFLKKFVADALEAKLIGGVK